MNEKEESARDCLAREMKALDKYNRLQLLFMTHFIVLFTRFVNEILSPSDCER